MKPLEQANLSFVCVIFEFQEKWYGTVLTELENTLVAYIASNVLNSPYSKQTLSISRNLKISDVESLN